MSQYPQQYPAQDLSGIVNIALVFSIMMPVLIQLVLLGFLAQMVMRLVKDQEIENGIIQY